MNEIKPQDILDEHFDAPERPDQRLLRQTVEYLEGEIGDFNFEDTICEPGEVVQLGGRNVVLVELSTSVKIPDADRDDTTLFEWFFAPMAASFAGEVKSGGYNVCRPLGIKNPNLTAENGTLQLTHQGNKVDVYMAHRYHMTEAFTKVTLKMLVGKV